MKIDRRKPRHWLYLLLMGLNVVAAIVLRPLLHRRRSGKVLLYGHKRNGNLLAIHEWVLQHRPQGLDLYYLTMDPAYYQQLRREGVPCVLAIAPSAIGWLATADAIVSDHGLHAMRFMLGTTDMKFFDVWHGIPFKGFDADDFRLQHGYDEVWVASESQRRLYVDKFGFDQAIVHASGYARTDRLVCRDSDPDAIKQSLGLDPETSGRLVLFAPTWKQDADDRSVFPFGLDGRAFVHSLSEWASGNNATVLVRTHLNSREAGALKFERVVALPSTNFPDTESILLVADLLVCDWSSIAFDFLLLDRPTLFLDIPAPFAKGFSLHPGYRFGPVIADFEALLETMTWALNDPHGYWARHGAEHQRVRKDVYAGNDDGKCSERCVQRLLMA